MIAEMKGVPLEFGEFGEMPCYKKVPEEYRVRRFQLGKLKLMMRDIVEEKAEIRRLAAEEDEAIKNTLREAEHASRNITAEALSHLGDDTVPRDNDLEETATVAEALSPKHMGDVDEHGLDLPALEKHAAQLAAAQAADGAASGSADATTSAAASALQRRAGKKIQPKPQNAPMAAVPEETQPSEASSYHTVDGSEKLEEQNEPPPDEWKPN
eukprot:3752752-Amphidinium_carterae.1